MNVDSASATHGLLAAVTAIFGGGWLRERRKLRTDQLQQALRRIGALEERLDRLQVVLVDLTRENARLLSENGHLLKATLEGRQDA